MDLICIACREPWDMDHVLHEDPDAFVRKHGVITHCPCCGKRTEPLSNEERDKSEAIAAIGDVLGDDIDGLAAEIENFGLI